MKFYLFRLVIFFFIIFLLGGLLATIIIFKEYNFEFFYLIYNIQSPSFLLIPFLTIINIFFRFLRWNFLLRSFSIFIPSRKLLVYYFISYIGEITPFYFFYILRLIPIFNDQKIKSVFIFILDIFLDFLSVMLLFYFSQYHHYLLMICIFAFLLLFVLHYIFRHYNKRNSLYFLSLFGFVISFSILIWYFTSFSLVLSLNSYGGEISLSDSIRIFHMVNLSNIFSLVPSGIYFSGKKALNALLLLNIKEGIAISSFILLRLFTTWTSVGIGIFFIFAYRKVFLAKVDHFDFIAKDYQDQIPDHIRMKVIEKKININLQYLPKQKFKVGLDAGCGQGWYLKEMMANGYTMYGIDYSKEQVKYATLATNNQRIKQCSITDTKFSDQKFDFVYTINVLHHLKSKEEQILALKEIHRILKKQGRLIIHEINIFNPLYKFYMSYIFPLINNIDEGVENWLKIDHRQFLNVGFRILQIEFFTFLPDFLPKKIYNLLEPIEKKLEQIEKIKKFSAHVCVVLEKL